MNMKDDEHNIVEFSDQVDLRELSDEQLVRFTYELDELTPLELELALRLESLIDLLIGTHPVGLH